jgi:hypothetical protein
MGDGLQKQLIYMACVCAMLRCALGSMIWAEDPAPSEQIAEAAIQVSVDVAAEESTDLRANTLAAEEAIELQEKQAPATGFPFVAAAVSAVSGLALWLFFRSGKERGLVLDHPHSWEDIGTVVQDAMRRFGRQVYGRVLFGRTPSFCVFESECRRKWVITERTDKLLGRSVWLVSINYACTHFEVHHREDRRAPVHTENLSSAALFDALMQARKHGPFRVTHHSLNERWNRLDAR